MHRTLFIEGLPGSGKSTFARRLASDLAKAGYRVASFTEGELHPLDLAWCAILSETELHEICERFPTLAPELRALASWEDNHYIVPYTRVRHPDTNHTFYDTLEQYEIYRTEDLDVFLQAHLKRWRRFSDTRDPDTIYVFECVYLQNHINELILKHDASFDRMMPYFQQLIDAVSRTNPLIVSIRQTDIETTLRRLIDERRSTDPSRYRDWIDNVTRYLEGTRHGRRLGFIGEEGMLRYEHHRQRLEQDLLDRLRVESVRFDLDQDYEVVYHAIKETVFHRMS